MKVLLTTLNAKYIHSNLALKYLYMEGAKVCDGLSIQEFTINNSRDYIFTELLAGEYDVICFSCYIWNIEQTLELAENLKKAQPHIRIALGGPEVSYDAEGLLSEYRFADFVIAGEGEGIFGLLCRAFNGELDYGQIRGLAYRQEDEIIVNPAALPLPFEEIPFPYDGFSCERDKVIYYESCRGCPFGCSYCISSLDKSVRELPADRVKRDVEHFLYKRVKQVKFLDRTFNWDKQRSVAILKHIIAIDTGDTNFHFEICADLLDEEIFEILQKARKGLFQFEIGVQSTNEETLQAINRSTDVRKVLANIRTLIEMGNSHIHADLIAGLPFESYEAFQDSFNKVYATGAGNLQLGFLKLLKGTEIRNTAEVYGYDYTRRAPYEIIKNQFISAKELARLKRIEVVLDLYYNRGGFGHSLRYIIDHFAATPFDFYERFSEYYYSRGFQHRAHRKEDLYRILYEYIHTITSNEKMNELLELDLTNTMNFDAVKKFKRKGWKIP